MNGNLYFSGLGNEGILSVPSTNNGVSRLSQTKYSSIDSVVSNDTNVYWSESDFGVGRVVKAPIIKLGVDPTFSPTGYSNQEVLPFQLSGPSLLSIDGNVLFVLDTVSGKIYKSNLTTGTYSLITTVTLKSVTGFYEMRVNPLYLYVLDGLDLLQIDKSTGQQTIVATGIDTMLTDFVADSNGVYWWQSNALKRLDSTTGAITTLATGVADGMSFGVDNTHIWWFDNVLNYTINRAPIATGIKELVVSYPFNQYQLPIQGTIYFDQNFIYWSGDGGVLLYKLAKIGGTPTIISKEQAHYQGFSVGSSSLSWGVGGGYIRHIQNKALGQADAASIWSFTPQPLSSASVLSHSLSTVSGNILYFIAHKHDLSDPLGADAMEIYSYDGISTTLLRKEYESIPQKIMVDSSGIIIYHVKNTGVLTNPYHISAMGLTGSPLINLVQSDTEIVGITLANEMLYFNVSNGLTYGELMSYSLNTQVLKPLTTTEPTTLSGIYADSTYVYWGDPIGTHRTPVNGGQKESVVPSSHALAITGDASYVYLSDGLSIKRMTK